MAIFKDKIVELSVSETYIGPDVMVKGDIILKSSLRIDGTLNGNISEAKFVMIGKTAKITGNISCEKCKLEGEVNGNIYALESAQLAETSVLNGDLKTASVSVETGARFNGKCLMENHVQKH